MILKGDSCLLNGGKPLFIPDWTTALGVTPCSIIRVSRMGKEIAPRFAHRYYDAIAPGMDFVAMDILAQAQHDQRSWTKALAFDYSLALGQWIAKEEWEKAQGVIWLDFNKGQFASIQEAGVNFVKDYPLLSNTFMQLRNYPFTPATNEYISRGIHQKGCGLLKYNEKRSVYNFVDQINLKLEAAGKPTLTKAQIYEEANQADVIEAIEELILDEAGLELAFEGNRFFDLMRVANRKANPGQFMAEKIGARSADAKTWASGLASDIKNWYLPLPDYSYRQQ